MINVQLCVYHCKPINKKGENLNIKEALDIGKDTIRSGEGVRRMTTYNIVRGSGVQN